MLFTCLIENTFITFGVFDGDRMVFNARLATQLDKSADEYAILFSSIFAMNGVAFASIGAAIVASVVPPLNTAISIAIEKLMKVKPMRVGPGIKTGLNIKTDIPSQVGADIVTNAVAAVSLVAGSLVVLDFGTATTLTGVRENGELCGVLICPGIETSLDALTAHAAELPGIALDSPRALFGKNTNDSLNSGFIFGLAAMIDGLLDRIAAEWHTMKLSVVATGEMAEIIVPFCTSGHDIRFEPTLALIGLKRIHGLNERRKPPVGESSP